MNKFYKGYDDIVASDVFKQKTVRMLTSEPHETATGLRFNRRIAAVAIAAAALVLAMGTAVAVGVSTAGRLRENTEERLETAEEVRYQAAREQAERIVDSASFTREIPLDADAAAEDVTIRLKEIECDGDELLLKLSATGEHTGMVLGFDGDFLKEDVHAQRILASYDSFCEIGADARDFRLTFGGSAYTPYYTADMPSALGYGDGDDLIMRFPAMPQIANGTEMTLSGTLYRCDGDGVRQGEIGAFSIPFVYDYTDAMREADIERETQAILKTQRMRDEQQQVNLNALPEEAVSLEQTVGFTTYHDVSADAEGIVLGVTDRLGGESTAQFRYFSMNGYRVTEEELASEYDEAQNTRTAVLRLPYYAQQQYLDPVLTVACVDVSGQETKTDDGWLPPTEYAEDVFVFRYDLRTGKVTLPSDETERDAWFTPRSLRPYERAYDFMNVTYRLIDVETETQTQNGVDVSIRRVAFSEDGALEIYYQAEHMACEVMTEETFPEEILINGEPAPRRIFRSAGFEWEPFRLSDERIAELIDTYDMEKTRWVINPFEVMPAKRLDMYDGPITIEVKNWALYDLNKQGEREYVGTFSFTFTADPADASSPTINPREGIRKN